MAGPSAAVEVGTALLPGGGGHPGWGPPWWLWAPPPRIGSGARAVDHGLDRAGAVGRAGTRDEAGGGQLGGDRAQAAPLAGPGVATMQALGQRHGLRHGLDMAPAA